MPPEHRPPESRKLFQESPKEFIIMSHTCVFKMLNKKEHMQYFFAVSSTVTTSVARTLEKYKNGGAPC